MPQGMERHMKPGAMYRHATTKAIARVVCTATHDHTTQELVIYRMIHPHEGHKTRAASTLEFSLQYTALVREDA